jgi:hypothetical protein
MHGVAMPPASRVITEEVHFARFDRDRSSSRLFSSTMSMSISLRFCHNSLISAEVMLIARIMIGGLFGMPRTVVRAEVG